MSTCPRCQTGAVELATIGTVETFYIGACACYPHPPKCASCRLPLSDAGRCISMECPVFDEVQPDPIVDPLWEPGLRHG